MIKQLIRSILILGCSVTAAIAQDHPEYAAKNIPKALLPHANAVMRDYSLEMDIISMQEVAVTEHYVVTVLNDKGNDNVDDEEYESPLNQIEDITGSIYDANGKKVSKIKESDFKIRPVSMRGGEFSDARYRTYTVNYRNYPYTVEYTVETKLNHTFMLPIWSPVSQWHCALEAGQLSVITHNNEVLKYKAFNCDSIPVITNGETTTYKWDIKNVPAKNKEPLSYTGNHIGPTLMLSVKDFMLDDLKGSTDSWKDYGAFIYSLNKGRDELPDNIKLKVRQMVAHAKDEHEKVKILYSYLQNTMRYVAVEYGIGGWQTLDAEFLSKNQYGDCKALSNYMMAMLRVAGITSYPVLINPGRDNQSKLAEDFVCSRFGHVILCVPFAKDTVWLECTSNDLPANYLSDFTQNREALMITPTGGVLVHTPVYDTTVNIVSRHAIVSCNENGNLRIALNSLYKGEKAYTLYYWLKSYNDHDKEQFLRSKFALPSYNLDDYSYKKIDEYPYTCVNEQAVITASGMYTKTGSRGFLLLDVAPIQVIMPDEDEDRKTPFYIPGSEATADTFEVALPAKSEIEYIPAPVSARYPFGSYHYAITRDNDKLLVTCSFKLNSGIYEPAQFADYIKLMNMVTNRSNKKVVLKTGS